MVDISGRETIRILTVGYPFWSISDTKTVSCSGEKTPSKILTESKSNTKLARILYLPGKLSFENRLMILVDPDISILSRLSQHAALITLIGSIFIVMCCYIYISFFFFNIDLPVNTFDIPILFFLKPLLTSQMITGLILIFLLVISLPIYSEVESDDYKIIFFINAFIICFSY